MKSAMAQYVATNRQDVWRIRLYFLMWIGGNAFLMPFVSLFFVREGLSGTEIGLVSTVTSAVALLAAPLWGRLSDITTHPVLLLQIELAGSALCMLWLSQQHLFVWIALVVAIEALLSAGTTPLSDALALGVSYEAGYGSVRLWGSLGWAILVLAAGWLIERMGLWVAFVGYAASLALGILILFGSAASMPPASQPKTAPRISPRTAAAGLLRNRAALGLAGMLVVSGLCSSGLDRFEPIYLDKLGAGETIIGLANTVAALVELPGMLWADRWIARFGPWRVLLIALVLKAGMMAAVLVAPSIPTIVAIRAVGGLAFSFSSVALIVFVSRHIAPQHATALALYTVTLHNLVGILGGPLAGIVYDAFGAYWLYALALGGYGLGWLILRLTIAEPSSEAAIT